MRATLALVAPALALLLAAGPLGLLPSASGLGGVSVCAPACEVPSHTTAGYLPPATVVLSGSTVTWSSLDVAGHSATSEGLCLHVTYDQGRPGSETFVVLDGVLHTAESGEAFRPCPEAQALRTGASSSPTSASSTSAR